MNTFIDFLLAIIIILFLACAFHTALTSLIQIVYLISAILLTIYFLNRPEI